MRPVTLFSIALFFFSPPNISAQSATITIDAGKKEAPVSKSFHGIFFEEISHAGEGGLYAELIQNRGFEEADIPNGMKLVNGILVPPQTPGFTTPQHTVSDWKMEWTIKSDYPAWSYRTNGNAAVQITRTDKYPLNSATPHSLQVDISKADATDNAEVINEGFWGINTKAGESYKLNFYLRSNHYKGAVTAMLQSDDGIPLATYTISSASNTGWKKYSAVLKATKSDGKAKFVLAFDHQGTIWLDFVSLFPVKTFKNRPNGLRPDLAQTIANLKPAFVRWPGGCYVEGINIQSAPDWKQSIGPVEKRSQAYSPWGYYSSNGFGYHEYLQFCEDIGAAALYVFNVGVSCEYRSGTFVPLDSMQPYVQSALDAIEYAIGPATSKWGKLRAAAGHPMPFPLKYVEIGNEQHGPDYAQRYNVFYDAIKKKCPQIQTIASMGIGDVNDYTLRGMKKVEYADEHAYKSAGWAFTNWNHFDKYKRGDWDMYVGEYATNNGVGAGNMEASLSDAVYIMSMEKNGDLVKMCSYAPLLVNTADVDWPVNLINFNDSASFARISYYAIKLFNDNRPTVNVSTNVKVDQPEIKTPMFNGGIGLADWDTKTAYKDIEVIKDGVTIYRSDFTNNLNDWSLIRGKWEVEEGTLAQTADGAQQFAMLKNKSWETYTLKLKAKKLAGYNAFIIPFAVKDSNTFYRAHIGGYINRVAMFEKVNNGYDVTNISTVTSLPDTIAINRWYDIELQVSVDTVKCYLDGKLLMTYTEPNKLFAIAGKDSVNGDIIIKVVNAYDKAIPVNIGIKGQSIPKHNAKVFILSAPNLTDENSFGHPQRFVPQASNLPVAGNEIFMSVKPFSINVVRVQTGKQ